MVAPLVTLWWQVLRATGCLAEPHGQNTLVTFDSGHVRIGYRDCGIYVDASVRQAAGVTGDLPPRNVIAHDIDKPAPQVRSLVYDTFLGHHALSYLARLAKSSRTAAEAATRRGPTGVPDAADLLRFRPPLQLRHQLHPDGGWRLIDTGDPPPWR